MRGKLCALTGHRTLAPEFDEYALHERLEGLINEGYDYFLCGMAMGFDLLALKHLIELKGKYPIQIEACIPCPNQEKYFPKNQKKLYRELLQWCDHRTLISQTGGTWVYLVRDRYMVDCCDCLLAYCKKQTGGAAYTVGYAQKKGVEVIFL